MMNEEIVGLVLMGGMSQRMGKDKSQLKYQNKKLYQLAAEKLSQMTQCVCLSINEKQSEKYTFEWPTILDKWADQGPLSGVISAFEKIQKPIFLVACDMPLVSVEDLQLLIDHYKSQPTLTMYINPKSKTAEPLISIWDESSLNQVTEYFGSGGRSFKGFVATHPHNGIIHQNEKIFNNINHPEDYLKI